MHNASTDIGADICVSRDLSPIVRPVVRLRAIACRAARILKQFATRLETILVELHLQIIQSCIYAEPRHSVKGLGLFLLTSKPS